MAEQALRRFLDDVEGEECKRDEQDVAKPRVESDEPRALKNAGVMDQVPHVEVEQVKAVTGLADEDEWAQGEELRDKVFSGEAEDDAAEERHEQSIVDDGIGDDWPELEQSERSEETADAESEAQPSGAGYDFVEARKHDTEDKAGQMRERRVFEGLEPGRGAPAIGDGEVVGVEHKVEGAGDHAQAPDAGQYREQRKQPGGALEAREPGEAEVVGAFSGHGPGRRVQEGGEFRDPALKQERRENHSGPEHEVSMGLVFAGNHAPGKDQAQQVDGIKAREAGFPKAAAVEGPLAGPGRVVICEDEAGEQDKEADRCVACVDDGGKPAEPIGI